MDFSTIYNQISTRIAPFLGVFFAVMVVGYGFLYLIDFVPEPVSADEEPESEMVEEVVEEPESTPTLTLETLSDADPLPISIYIPDLDRTVKVLNPKGRDVASLDSALLSGAVRHPDSADLSGPGNILIMGHSSYLKNVFNKNFQAFNGIQNLTWGDTVIVTSGDMEYTYQVDRVYKATASAVEVPVDDNEYKLTLVTCNTFGAKEDRFIVEATLISKKAL